MCRKENRSSLFLQSYDFLSHECRTYRVEAAERLVEYQQLRRAYNRSFAVILSTGYLRYVGLCYQDRTSRAIRKYVVLLPRGKCLWAGLKISVARQSSSNCIGLSLPADTRYTLCLYHKISGYWTDQECNERTGSSECYDEWQWTDSFWNISRSTINDSLSAVLKTEGRGKAGVYNGNIYTIICMEIIHIQSNRERQGFIWKVNLRWMLMTFSH